MNHKIPAHVQRNNTKPTAIKMGVIFVRAVVGIGPGLAGTLPAYSAGAGGGGAIGLEAEGTAAARGEAMVAAGSNVDAS